MQFFTAAILILSMFLSGCALTYPTSKEEQATYYTSDALAKIEKGDCHSAAIQIDEALSRPTGSIKIKKLFESNPKSQKCYFSTLEKNILNLSSASEADQLFNQLTSTESAGIFTENQQFSLFDKLRKQVADGNLSGSIPFEIGDNFDHFPNLKTPLHQNIIINRSINYLQGNCSGIRPVLALMEYVQRTGVSSAEGKRIESLLPTLHIRSNEIDVVTNVFPAFAASR